MSEPRIAMWASIVCSNVWSAKADSSLGFAIAAMWLAFAALMLYASKRTSAQEPQP
jgi:dipeptide/tripeptide permease